MDKNKTHGRVFGTKDISCDMKSGKKYIYITTYHKNYINIYEWTEAKQWKYR